MPLGFRGYSALAVAFAGFLPAQQTADTLGPYGRVVQSWMALHVSPGREAYAMERIRDLDAGWQPGALGSVIRTRGEGSPYRVVACGLDETSYVVSNITDDGYLRVHVAGSRGHSPSWDGFHLGQRIMVVAGDRANSARVRGVPGVFGVRSTHLWRGSSAAAGAVTLEDLWIDVGARSRAEVAALGVRLLDPVFRDAPDWSVGDAVVGPAAASRAGCAAVAAAAEQTPATGRTTFVVSAQSSFGWAGLSAVIAALGEADDVFVVTPDSQRVGRGIRVRPKFPGTLIETLRESELRTLFDAVASAAGTATGAPPEEARLLGASLRPPQPTDSLRRYAELLARLTDSYSVSSDEAPVRDVLRARMPVWARDLATTDSAGNFMLAMGPDRDTVVFIAHMDEVGFEIVGAPADGIVTVRQLGGFYPSLFAGQPALLHVPSESGSTSDRAQGCRPLSGNAIRGVFLPADTANRNPRELKAWFGDQLASAGVVTGLKVTSFKCATRLGATRFTARSIDDRAGSAALLLALDGINPAKLDHKVLFVWSVREESGLAGARAIATALRTSVRRVHAVDTYVSADAPLETGRFAVVPIGAGAVVRVLDNGSIAPPEEVERVVRIARAAGIPLQVNTTNGSTDGSVFAPFGAFNVAISWPLRYSHSPAELIDLRDLRSLTRLVTALAVAPVR